MVSLSDITLNNTSLSSPGSGPIAALISCTSGIGLSTLHALLRHTSSPTIYLVDHDTRRLDALISAVQPLNQSATLHAIHTSDLALVHDAQLGASQIASHAPRLDLLIMSPSPDHLPFSPHAQLSSEGIDKPTALRVHSRMRILTTLLPLLRLSRSPRVLSILAGGQEGPLSVSELCKTRSETTTSTSTSSSNSTSFYGPLYTLGAAASMTTLLFEHLSTLPGNERLVFAHVFPGGTELEVPEAGTGDSAEVGERVLFVATNGRFRRLTAGGRVSAVGTLIQQGSDGVQGSGVYLVDADSSVVDGGGNAILKALRGQGAGEVVYDYLMAEFERIGALGG